MPPPIHDQPRKGPFWTGLKSIVSIALKKIYKHYISKPNHYYLSFLKVRLLFSFLSTIQVDQCLYF